MASAITHVSASDVKDMLAFYYRTSDAMSKRNDAITRPFLEQTLTLLSRDYLVGRISNENHELCSTYPPELFILQEERPLRRSVSCTSLPELSSSAPRESSVLHDSYSAGRRASILDDTWELEIGPDQRRVSVTSSTQQPVIDPPTQMLDGADFELLTPEIELAEVKTFDDGVDADDRNAGDDDSGGGIVSELFDSVIKTPKRPVVLTDEDSLTPINASLQTRDDEPIASGPDRSSIVPPTRSQSVTRVKTNETNELRRLMEECRYSRVRSRLAVPVMLVRGQNICRSSTLAHEAEILLNYAQYEARSLFFGAPAAPETGAPTAPTSTDERPDATSEDLTMVNKQRKADIELLKWLGVKYIIDLMVENKKVKYGLNVCSSEKVDSARRYAADFSLVTVPYPGCEFFKEFHDRGHCARGLKYNWDQYFINAVISVPDREEEFASYKEWDLVTLTQKYLQLTLSLLIQGGEHKGPAGLLIHCISGWDRTPLFTSLLRLSLWADGEIHASLNPTEMLYLTIGYDWLLYGHLLADRAQKGEDILLFCFYFISLMEGADFALPVLDMRAASPAPSEASSSHGDSPLPMAVPRSQAREIYGRHRRTNTDELSTSWSVVQATSNSLHTNEGRSWEARMAGGFSNPPHDSSPPEAMAGAAPPPSSGTTISKCSCCGVDAMAAAAADISAEEKCLPANIRSQLAQRRQKLRALRSLFMQLFSEIINKEPAVPPASIFGFLRGWS